MPSGYVCLDKKSPRSFLFYVVANIGPGGSTRPLAVAYRQGNDVSKSPLSRVKAVANDILSLVKVLSEPANRVPLEAERALATGWHRHQDTDTDTRRIALPDSPQPPFVGYKDKWKPSVQPEMPWNDALREFPFTSTCLLLGLLRGSNSTRPGDVQLQSLSTPFYGDCLEYGMVIVDISNLERVKYGIVAFPVCYMAHVYYHSEVGGWDPVEDPPPEKEPDVVLVDERPRVALSILGYLRKSFPFLEDDPNVLELEACPMIDDPGVLDYIWPLEPLSSGQDTVLDAKQSAMPLEMKDGKIDWAAFAGCAHLNLVQFQNLTFDVIAAALASDELRETTALSVCVDHLSGDMDSLTSAVANATSLKHLCLLQKPDRRDDDASARLGAILLSALGEEWPGGKSIILTCAFSAPLRREAWLPQDITPSVQAFPVAYMFVRLKKSGKDRGSRARRCYMGDALLDPERFALGFISYIKSVGKSVDSDRSLLQFSCGPSSLDHDASSSSSSPSAALAVSPVTAEALAHHPKDEEREAKHSKTRDVQSGGWLVLIDAQRRGQGKDAGGRRGKTTAGPLRYSFIRTRKAISAMAADESDGTPQEYIEIVGSLKAFLAETAPSLDLTNLETLLEETAKDVGMEILEEDEAREMLQEMWME